MATCKITRKDDFNGISVEFKFKRNEGETLLDAVKREILNDGAHALRINDTFNARQGELLDLYLFNFKKQEWVKFLDFFPIN